MTKDPKVKPLQISKAMPPSLSFHFEDFDVVHEGWNRYKLADGSIVKTKFVLINVMLEKTLEELFDKAKEGKVAELGFNIAFQSKNVAGVEAPEKLRGSPSSGAYSPQELQSSIIEKDIDFEVISERRNEYRLKNGITIKIKHSPLEISKSDKFDTQGLPMYFVKSSAELLVALPKRMEKELRQLKKLPK